MTQSDIGEGLFKLELKDTLGALRKRCLVEQLDDQDGRGTDSCKFELLIPPWVTIPVEDAAHILHGFDSRRIMNGQCGVWIARDILSIQTLSTNNIYCQHTLGFSKTPDGPVSGSPAEQTTDGNPFRPMGAKGVG